MKKVGYLIKVFILFVVSIFSLMLLACATGCGGNENPDNDSASKIVLSQRNVILEKLETVTLVAQIEGDDEDVTWTSTNSEVASVVDGEIKALKEGSTIIKCKTAEAEDKCIVTVIDSKLTLNVVTNINDGELNLIQGDDFDIVYFVTYNNKIVDANVNIETFNAAGIIELAENKLTAIANGQSKILITAEWEGLSVRKVFDVNVVNNFTAKLLEQSSVTLCLDSRGGLSEIQLSPKLYENDELLNEADYEIISFTYDDSIIRVEESTLVIEALSKGSTQLEVTFQSKTSSDTVSAVLPVEVHLYNEDKFDTVRIPDASLNENAYEIKLIEVFGDLSEENREGLHITKVLDVTGSTPVELKIENGFVDLSYFRTNDVLGERRWRVETERYSYEVKIVVEKLNYALPLVGKYVADNWNYGVEISIENRQKVFHFYDVNTAESKYKGIFELTAWNENSGRIQLKLDTPFSGQTEFSGVYWSGSGKVFLDLKVNGISGGYAYLYSESGAPYEEISGIYKNDVTWSVDFKLNGDGTCVFDYNNEISKKCNGRYELTSLDAYNGKIRIEIESEFFGQTEFEGNYYLKKGLYYFDVYVDVFGNKQTLTQTEMNVGAYEAFAGYYTCTPSWLHIKLMKDRTIIFDYTQFGGSVNTAGTYELIGDTNSGTVIINLNKAYVGQSRLEGVYELKDGVYVFVLKVKGLSVDAVTYKQRQVN